MTSERDQQVLERLFGPGEGSKPKAETTWHSRKEEERAWIRMAEKGQAAEAAAGLAALAETLRASGEDDGSAQVNRVQALVLQGAEAQAQDEIAALLARQPALAAAHQANLYNLRGTLYGRHGHAELARQQFEQAKLLGSAFGHQEYVRLNPYTQLCNQTIASMFSTTETNKV